MIPIPPIRIERVRTKLSLEAYAELCRILARAPRVPFKVGMGRAPSPPWSHGRLAKQFGISQARVSQIAKQVREGTAGCRAFGVRAVQPPQGSWQPDAVRQRRIVASSKARSGPDHCPPRGASNAGGARVGLLAPVARSEQGVRDLLKQAVSWAFDGSDAPHSLCEALVQYPHYSEAQFSHNMQNLVHVIAPVGRSARLPVMSYTTIAITPKLEARLETVRERITERSGGLKPSMSSTLNLLVERGLPGLEAELGLAAQGNVHHE